ncbi:hypothetical protein P9020_08445 [Bacillus thuringiensis]|uniref:hypothetical protein n=1 Tax=Bacillus thuringiensis TaxID=1428 RepID=UPI002DBED1CC|nr:hypothetical protein [Bacillus thuringiensis]MEC3228218.1 hypothetical protein [Bacillus thuringiensis]
MVYFQNAGGTPRSLVSKPGEQYEFIRKVSGAQGYFMLWLLLEEMHEKEMLALE